MVFRLELFANDPEHVEASRKAVIERAQEFKSHYLFRHPQAQEAVKKEWSDSLDERALKSFFESMDNGSFWQVLGFVDGTRPEYSLFSRMSSDEWKKQNKGKQERARKLFSERDLNDILNIAANQALLGPLGFDGAPGLRRGHSILFEDLVQKEDSMFKEVVTEPLVRLLNNGRFWEELPHMNTSRYGHPAVEHVLTNYFPHLSVAFAPQGFDIFKRNKGMQHDWSLRSLSDQAVDRYAKFMQAIDSSLRNLKLSTEEMQHLLVPYVRELVKDDDPDRSEEDERFRNSGGRKSRLREPFLRGYLERSDIIRDAVAKSLASNASYFPTEDTVRHVLEVTDIMPDKTGTFTRMLNHMKDHPHDVALFTYTAAREGFSLDALLGLKPKTV